MGITGARAFAVATAIDQRRRLTAGPVHGLSPTGHTFRARSLIKPRGAAPTTRREFYLYFYLAIDETNGNRVSFLLPGEVTSQQREINNSRFLSPNSRHNSTVFLRFEYDVRIIFTLVDG